MADRRSFLRGFATLPLIGGSVAVLSPVAAIAKGSANDATLIACCDKLRGILAAQRDLCRAYPGIDCDKTPGWDETEEGRAAVLAQVTEMPAAGLAGIAAKAEVLQISDVSEDSMWSDAIGQSIADDVLRLHRAAIVLSAVGCPLR